MERWPGEGWPGAGHHTSHEGELNDARGRGCVGLQEQCKVTVVALWTGTWAWGSSREPEFLLWRHQGLTWAAWPMQRVRGAPGSPGVCLPLWLPLHTGLIFLSALAKGSCCLCELELPDRCRLVSCVPNSAVAWPGGVGDLEVVSVAQCVFWDQNRVLTLLPCQWNDFRQVTSMCCEPRFPFW